MNLVNQLLFYCCKVVCYVISSIVSVSVRIYVIGHVVSLGLEYYQYFLTNLTNSPNIPWIAIRHAAQLHYMGFVMAIGLNLCQVIKTM